MEVNKILTADILDIIFDGRNKDYGAYELRKTYNKRITTSLLVMLGLVVALVAGYFINNYQGAGKKAAVVVQDVQLEDIKEEKPSSIIQNNDNLTFNDSSGNYNYYCSIPNHILDNLNDYIALLKKQNESLEEENKKLNSK